MLPSSGRNYRHQVPKLDRFFFLDIPVNTYRSQWHKVLETRYTMADRTPTQPTPKDLKQRSRALKEIDRANQNDAAFELVTKFVCFLC